MTAFADAIKRASAEAPQASGSVPVSPNRLLVADGDGLAYYCAGNDDTTPGEARANLLSKLDSARRLVGASDVRILTTLSGSHKGHRYAIARVKPYQGQRTNSRRPKNWQYLRDLLTSERVGGYEVQGTATAEADDLFGWYAYNFPDDTVIYTQDKDMRMLPGLHLDWVTHRTHKVDYHLDKFCDLYRAPRVRVTNSVFNEKQYGPRWFWLQMLHGDQADNIPGLPKVNIGGKLKPVGEVTANKLLSESTDELDREVVAKAYESYYGERWLTELIEQACLLWMRRDPDKWDDCLDPGGPLESYNDGSEFFAKSYFEIEHRVRTADAYNSNPPQDDTGS